MFLNQEMGLQLEYQLRTIKMGKATTPDTQSSDMMPAQVMSILWDLGMSPSFYTEVNDFSGGQNSPSMEEGFKDTI